VCPPQGARVACNVAVCLSHSCGASCCVSKQQSMTSLRHTARRRPLVSFARHCWWLHLTDQLQKKRSGTYMNPPLRSSRRAPCALHVPASAGCTACTCFTLRQALTATALPPLLMLPPAPLCVHSAQYLAPAGRWLARRSAQAAGAPRRRRGPAAEPRSSCRRSCAACRRECGRTTLARCWPGRAPPCSSSAAAGAPPRASSAWAAGRQARATCLAGGLGRSMSMDGEG